MVDSQNKLRYLDVLQVFRGIAALMVVLHHTINSLKYYHNIDNQWLNYLAYLGKFGVDFFFVLSGFIITYAAHNKYNQSNSFVNYLTNRLIRIYVPYLPIGILMLMLYSFMPNFSNGGRTISTLTSLTLLPNGNPALSVAWTLTFELFFYLLFGLSFVSKKLWIVFVFIWSNLIIYLNFFNFGGFLYSENKYLKILFSTYNIEFILGYLLAIAILKKIKIKKIFINFLLILTSIIFVNMTYFKLNFFVFDKNLLLAIIVFFGIYLAIEYKTIKIKKMAVLMLIGNATYSIYLIHNPLQMILVRLFPKIESFLGALFVLTLVVLACCILGYGYYLIFEKKAIQFIKSKTQS